jgi:hypothetical protein
MKGNNLGVPTLNEWCTWREIDWAIINDVIFIMKKQPLPMMAPTYVPYPTTTYNDLVKEFILTDIEIPNLCIEIQGDTQGFQGCSLEVRRFFIICLSILYDHPNKRYVKLFKRTRNCPQ